MEVAPELQFKHYTPREVHLPAAALVSLEPTAWDAAVLCCDLERHVFNPEHTGASLAEALRASHWFDLREWAARSPIGSP
jgi:hypothetical protein